MLEKYKNWNTNSDLWKNIEQILQATSKNIVGKPAEKLFNNLYLTKNCYIKKGENPEFINIAETSFIKDITYFENRFSENSKKWNKEKSSIEGSFKQLFPRFQLPERSFKAITNPLFNKTVNSVLDIEDLETEVLPYSHLEKMYSLNLNTLFQDRLFFQFSIKKEDTYLLNPTKTGLNEIESNVGYIKIKIKILISSPLEYCNYVTNSKDISEVLYFNYINQQLNAYLGYCDYPNVRINVMEESPTFFSKDVVLKSKYISLFPTGQIINIPPVSLTYDEYLKETRISYSEREKEIKKELFEIPSLRNRILSFNTNLQQLIYTDNFGNIQRLDLIGFEELSSKQLSFISNLKVNSIQVSRFFEILKGFYYKIFISNHLDFDSIIQEICNTGLTLREIFNNKEKFLEFYKILNSCKNSWDSVNFEVLSKIKNKIFLDVLLGLELKEEPQIVFEDLRILNKESNLLPTTLINCLKSIQQRNQLYDFPSCFREDFFFSLINTMILNKKVKRPLIVTSQPEIVYNKIKLNSEDFNLVLLNSDTFRNLYKNLGKNLVTYFKSLPINSIIIFDQELFSQGYLLGDTDLLLANKLSFRYLMVEFLKSLEIDFIVFYKNKDIDYKDLLALSLRQLFSQARFRIIYGNLNYQDMLLLDPNTNVLGKSNFSDLKQNSVISEGEAKSSGKILLNYSDIFLFSLPRINEEFYSVDIGSSQREYYMTLVNTSFNLLQNDQEFKNKLIQSDLDDRTSVIPYYSNYLSLADVFLNAPDSNIFSYKEKFEENEENSNLISSKVDLLYSFVYSHLFGGVVQGKKINSKKGKILIISENRIVQDHLFSQLNKKFYDKPSFKFELGNSFECEKFNSEYDVGFITRDIFNRNVKIENITEHIITQNPWELNFLNSLKTQIYFNALNTNQDDSININYLLFNKSLEINKLVNCFNFWIELKYKKLINKNSFKKYKNYTKGLKYLNISLEQLNLEDFSYLESSDLLNKYQEILNYEYLESYIYKENLLNKILERTGTKLSLENLKLISFDTIKQAPFKIKDEDFIPFIPNMYFNKFNLIPFQTSEKFSDINGNEVFYGNTKVWNKENPVFTQYGTGLIKQEVPEGFLINIPSFQDVTVSKEEVYIPKYEKDLFFNYFSILGKKGSDCLLPKSLLDYTNLNKKEEDIRLDETDNSIELSIANINGYHSIFTTNIDSDNIKLENYNFNAFNNVFIIPVRNNFDLILQTLTKCGFDSLYLNIIKQVYNDFQKGNSFLIPPRFNYFQENQINKKEKRCFPLIINKQFSIIFNGNFYQKSGYKISKRVNVDLIKNIYIQQFELLKDCKFELSSVTKTLNVINLQEVLKYFQEKYLKLEFIELVVPSKESKDISLSESLLLKMKEKEARLKSKIKQLRREDNAL